MQERNFDPARLGAIHWWATGMREITWHLMGDGRGRLLDVGCGRGLDLAKLPPGVWGVGLDRAAQQLLGTPFAQADAGRLPFRAGSFDLVLALDLLEQEGVDPTAVLSEIRRVVRGGGRMLARVPAHPWLYGPHDHAWGGARRYRKAEFRALVEGAGFTIYRLTYANSFLFPLAALVRLGGRAGLVGDDPAQFAQPFGRFLRRILSSEARLVRERDLPTGLSLVCVAGICAQASEGS
jgi:SAM-dependent methyltransferase